MMWCAYSDWSAMLVGRSVTPTVTTACRPGVTSAVMSAYQVVNPPSCVRTSVPFTHRRASL